jgi:hypothetical protein
MKPALWSIIFALCLSLPAHGDLTIVQKVEGGGPPADMTIKIKADKVRIDASPQLTTIVDGKTGEMVNLMKDEKKIVRISADKMKAAVGMMKKYNGGDKQNAEPKPKLTATGRKEKTNGFDTEEYVYETSTYKATYWVAPNYPNAAVILKQLQTLNPDLWAANGPNMPDYRQFPGVPIKTVVSMAGNQITTTLTSINQDPISDSEFLPPPDFQEMKLPDIGNLLGGEEKQAPDSSP